MTLVKFKTNPASATFNNLVDDFFAGLPVFSPKEIFPFSRNLVPANILESDTGYSLEIIAPGFEKSDLKIMVDDQVLTISAERKKEDNKENGKQIRKEYEFESFKRSFTLTEKIDASAIDASYSSGILTLNLPKVKSVEPEVKTIEVK